MDIEFVIVHTFEHSTTCMIAYAHLLSEKLTMENYVLLCIIKG